MSLLSDVRFALRSLRRRPAFAAATLTILALGIGANTAIFSVVDAVLLRPLPYGDVGSLVVIFGDGSARGQANRLGTSVADFLDWREQARVFSGLVALRNESRRITSVETPIVPLVHAVSPDYFDVLGVRPLIGRGFVAGEDAPGKHDVVILSHGIWQSAFGGDAGIIGRSIGLDDRQHTVVGVMPADFYSAHFIPVQPGLWVPAPVQDLRQERSTRDRLVYGRLAPGKRIADARADMAAVTKRIAQQHPETNDRWSANVVPLRDHAVGQFSRTGAILLAAVGVVLLIACANVASLTLARASERVQEIATRAALGAGRSRVVVQLLTESLVLSVGGGALGALLAYFAAEPLARLIPAQASVPFLDRVAVEGRVLLFGFALSIVSGVAFGLAPARQAARLDLVDALRAGGRGNVRSPAQRLRNGLITAEMALAVVIVAAAGLLLRSFSSLAGVDPGFDAARVLKLRTSLRGDEFQSPASRVAHFEELTRRLEALPGVASTSAVSFEPPPVIAGAAFGAVRIEIPGLAETAASAPSAVVRVVMPRYFQTLGMSVLKGRDIARADTAQSRRVAVISESMARRYFADAEPIGRSFAVYAGPEPQPLEVVGVVGDIITGGSDPTPQPSFYVPYAQNPLAVMSVVLRVPQGDAAAPAREAEKIAWSLSRSTNVYAIETLDRRIADLNWRTRLGATLLGGFAVLALALGAFGIYAVVSYTVLQRRSEIGLRMALGAGRSQVLGMVLRGSLMPVLWGLATGTLAAVAAAQALTGFLYGVRPGDPATHAGVLLLLLGVAVAASLAPALRATRVDPQQALRT
jgi:putative ABC transport system permease protein